MFKSVNKPSVILALALSVGLSGCHKNPSTVTTPSAPVPVNQRIAQYVQILATANMNAATVVVGLKDAGVLTADKAALIATYQTAIARATTGMSQILAQPGNWADKAILIQNLGLSLAPPSEYDHFGAANNTQFQALVTSLNAMESTIKIIVQMAQQAPPPAAK